MTNVFHIIGFAGFMVFNAIIQKYFSYISWWSVIYHGGQLYIMVVSFIGGENRSTQRKPLTCRKSLTNLIT